MEEALQQLIDAHDNLSSESVERSFESEDGEETYHDHYVKGVRGISDLQVQIHNEEGVERLQRIVNSGCHLLSELLGYRDADGIFVLARRESPMFAPRWDSEGPLEIQLSYGSKAIDLVIGPAGEDGLIIDVANTVSRRRRSIYTGAFKISLRGLGARKYLKESLEQDVEAILDSVLYDLDLTYGVSLLPLRVDAMRTMVRRRRRPRSRFPEEPLNLVYKEYAPELLQYYRLAKKTDYLPFQFLCYFHILEFFADRSAFRAVTDVVKRMITKHDFHAKSDKYVRECVQVFRRESDKHSSDKVKLQRVLTQFVNAEDVKVALGDIEVLGHFEKECTIDCSKPLKLPALSFETDSKFFQTLTSRIYALRCSIVHSNPDFDPSKAIPFVSSPQNLELLRTEIVIAAEVGRQVIAGAAAET